MSYKTSLNLPADFTITHHAGAFGKEDNSLESVEFSTSENADIIEFDVTFRRDGTPVIIHKGEPEDNEGASFEKALEIVSKAQKTKINLDLKSVKNLPEVDRLVKKYNMEKRVFFTGVGEEWTDTVKSNSFIPYFLNYALTKEESEDKEKAEKLASKISSHGAIGLNSYYEFASDLICSVMHKNNLLVSFWTVNDSEAAERVAKCLPDNITTRKPDVVKEVIESL